MSAGGNFASGLLQGFAQSYTAARVRATQMEVEQRHQLAGTLMQLYPNARPEAQQDIAQRLLTIYSTPSGKKLDKKLTDIGTLGQAAVQGGNAAGAQAASTGSAAGQAGAAAMPPPPATGSAGGPISSDAAAPPPATVGASVPGASPSAATLGGAPRIPAPPSYSPFLSPAEKNQQAAASISATEGAKVGAELDARKKAADAMNLTGRDRENFIAGRMLTPFSHWQQKQYVDPEHPGQPMTGFFDPITRQVVDGDGNAIDNPMPWITAVNSPSTPFRATLQAGLSQGRPIAEILNDWNTRKSSILGVRMVQQPDGSILAVPVETSTTTQTHGALPTPPGSPQAKGVGGGGGAGVRGTGTVVGGKIPMEVQKAQTQYQDSVSRYNVMADALPKALAGDQQAMINLLYNHIGMTIGLQKGARITRDIIEEAQHSAPWMATLLARVGVGNGFEMTPDLLRGVVLPPETMHNMLSLAENRLGEDYRKFSDTRDYYSKGGSQLPKPPSDVVGGAKDRNAKPSGTPPPPSKGTVMMRSPDGKHTKPVPADQVDHFKSLGATVVTQ